MPPAGARRRGAAALASILTHLRYFGGRGAREAVWFHSNFHHNFLLLRPFVRIISKYKLKTLCSSDPFTVHSSIRRWCFSVLFLIFEWRREGEILALSGFFLFPRDDGTQGKTKHTAKEIAAKTKAAKERNGTAGGRASGARMNKMKLGNDV